MHKSYRSNRPKAIRIGRSSGKHPLAVINIAQIAACSPPYVARGRSYSPKVSRKHDTLCERISAELPVAQIVERNSFRLRWLRDG